MKEKLLLYGTILLASSIITIGLIVSALNDRYYFQHYKNADDNLITVAFDKLTGKLYMASEATGFKTFSFRLVK